MDLEILQPAGKKIRLGRKEMPSNIFFFFRNKFHLEAIISYDYVSSQLVHIYNLLTICLDNEHFD
jgi:hypothetical protein